MPYLLTIGCYTNSYKETSHNDASYNDISYKRTSCCYAKRH